MDQKSDSKSVCEDKSKQSGKKTNFYDPLPQSEKQSEHGSFKASNHLKKIFLIKTVKVEMNSHSKENKNGQKTNIPVKNRNVKNL